MITDAHGLKALAVNSSAEAPGHGARAAESSKFDTAIEVVRDAFVPQTALPNFVYPSVFGATQAERTVINSVLDSLPLKDVGTASTITVSPDLGDPGLLGYARPAIGSINLNRSGYGMDTVGDFRYTLVHEIGHTVDMPDRVPQVLLGPNSSHEAFGKPDYVTDYASTMRQEDFAESYAYKRLAPKQLEKVAPEKARALEEMDRPTLLESLVDQPAFRESGKALGQMLEVTPWLRWGAEIAGQVAIAVTGVTGVADVVEGAARGDGRQAVSGLLKTGAATGFALAFHHPALAPAGLALLGADRGLQKATAAEADTKTTAAAMAAAGVGGVVGGIGLPLGLTWTGYQVAGPIGGAVGLVVGSVVGHRLGANLGANAALALAEHQKARPDES